MFPGSGATATGSRSPIGAPRSSTGRSDATINRGGVRMGTSEIYRAVLALDEVVDALVLDLPLEGTDGSCPSSSCSVTGSTLDDELVARLRARIREDCSPRHVPDVVEQIAEVPRTLSGQGARAPRQAILLGAAADDRRHRDALANPAALDPSRSWRETALRTAVPVPDLLSK